MKAAARKHAKKLHSLAGTHRQFILYAGIGLTGVVLDFLLYTLFVEIFNITPVIANFMSISLAILNNFLLNRRYTFKIHDHVWKRFAFFYAVGFVGILISDFLLVILHYGFSMDAVLAKLLTLPIILIAQYGLNRKLSFGEMDATVAGLKRAFRHWPAYLLALVFVSWSLAFVHYIPAEFAHIPPARAPAGAPDEATHYNYNVNFILTYHRLPVSGKDDISAYQACRDNPSAKVTCVYSYSFYPGASYVVDAISASTFSKATGMLPQIGSRLPGVFYGLVFVLCLYFAAYLVSRRRLTATLILIAVGLIPQLIFTVSYTNLDSHSIAISGLLGLALVLFMQQPLNRKRLIFLAIITGGLLPLAKYNFFVLGLPVILAFFYAKYKKLITWQRIGLFAYWAVGAFIVLASFWFIRNLVLYHDLLGQSFALKTMSHYHWLGQPVAPSLESYSKFAQMTFGEILFRSFYVGFGGMFYYLQDYQYTVIAVLDILALTFGIYFICDSIDALKRRKLVAASLLYGLIFALSFVQVVSNSLVYDFQPQGRYMFPILICTGIYLAYCIRLDKRFQYIAVLLAGGTLYMFIEGFNLFMRVYYNG